MKSILLCIISLFASLLLSNGDTPRRDSYIVAITLEKAKAIPATITFSIREEEKIVDLFIKGKKWTAPLILRDVPELKGNPVTKMFDAVFIADDRLSSITLSGRFFDYTTGNGDGLISFHNSAQIASSGGLPSVPATIEVGSLSIQKLTTDQAPPSDTDRHQN